MYGWVQHNRNGRFLALRDSYGITQLVVPEALVVPEELRTKVVAKIPLESVVCAKGVVRRRPVGQENKNMPTGEVEVILSEIKVLGEANSNLPFLVGGKHNKPKEPLRLKYRYLDLRSKEMQYNLRLRSQFLTKVRDFFNAYGFIEVETPTMFKSTPGGAKEFVVPTREKDKFLSLVQSPQQMKQLLMVGGLDRYYQIARCYRDEGTKDDRQPEFTQIDVEASFVRRKDILNLIEQLLLASWPPIAGKIRVPFPRISYSDAMKNYGTDKPDLRFDMRVSLFFTA
jgi:aspartyl-tRNA synthetase